MVYSITITKNDTHTEMNLTDILFSERSQMQKITYTKSSKKKN